MKSELEFYDVKERRKFRTNKWWIETKEAKGRKRYFAVAPTGKGHNAWRIVPEEFARDAQRLGFDKKPPETARITLEAEVIIHTDIPKALDSQIAMNRLREAIRAGIDELGYTGTFIHIKIKPA